ncbi:hypothetical protein [Cellvibrio sp. UBA7671]|uniref:hypothetical protein n=1 Tax=Cellvibrio sp. UBA7671 TaxID=1946312 RepID=UPI002F356D1B
MKFIDSRNFNSSLSDMAQRLTNKGILVSTTDDYANIPGKTYVAQKIKMGIWIHLNHQYDDAIAVIANPKHEPTSRLTFEQMEKIRTEAKHQFGKIVESAFTKCITYFLALGLLFLLGYILINILL